MTLVALLALLTIGPVMALAVFSTSTMYSSQTSASNKRVAGIGQLASLYVQKEMTSLTALGDSYVKRPSLIGYLRDGNHNNYDASAIAVALADFRSIQPATRFAAIIDPAGTFWGDEVPPAAPSLNGQNYSGRDWYQGYVRTGKAYVSAAYVGAVTDSPLLVAISDPVRADGRYAPAGTVVGILLIAYELTATQQLFSEFAKGEGVQIEVTDQAGVIIAQSGSTPTELVRDGTDGVTAALVGTSSVRRETYRGQDYFDAYAPVAVIGWTVVGRIPASAVLAGADELRNFVIVIAAVLIGVLVLGKILVYYILRDRQSTLSALESANSSLEQRVAMRTAELEAANSDLEAFTYSVSHDLRAPLRAMTGFSSLLQRKESTHLDADEVKYLQRIDANAGKMTKLVDDLLSFARLGRAGLTLARVEPNAIASAAFADLQQQAVQSGVEVVIGAMPSCTADAALLHQVYTNLLSNAIKFSRGRPGARVEIGAHQENGENVYDVRDNGVGFDMRYAGKLFGVFQRLHTQTEFEGTGVGLALVQKIIKRHGGRIWAEAEVDNGATFHFSLAPDSPTHMEVYGNGA